MTAPGIGQLQDSSRLIMDRRTNRPPSRMVNRNRMASTPRRVRKVLSALPNRAAPAPRTCMSITVISTMPVMIVARFKGVSMIAVPGITLAAVAAVSRVEHAGC